MLREARPAQLPWGLRRPEASEAGDWLARPGSSAGGTDRVCTWAGAGGGGVHEGGGAGARRGARWGEGGR